MALTPGTRLGVYEVTAQIGVGGMGEVYRATDSNLKRSVAIKVLPASVASDADRLARFQREAEVLAALNHPNIAAIYGLEKTLDFTALVMELVEGEDLSQRIARGAIPIDEALPIAKQIAEALEAAHEQGIIHRDLKPANIKVRSDGTVKVLDFGLAKAMEPAAGSSLNMSMSPTITTPAMTQAGMILGTAAYMSPEQAKGRAADKRSDVWSFGCVFYEMLAGKRAFEGEDVSDTLAGVLRGQPDWDALPADVSAQIQLLIKRCLEKDRRTRISDIGVARFLMAETIAPAQSPAPATLSPSPTAHRPRIAWAAIGLAAGLVVAAAGTWALMKPALQPAPQEVRFTVAPAGPLPVATNSPFRDFALSPDGARLAYVTATSVSDSGLWVRAIDQLDAVQLRGLTTPVAPFFSPDGKWIGFGSGSEIKKVSTTGGPPISLCRFPAQLRGASWGSNDTIVFATSDATTGLLSVPAGGGDPKVLTKPDAKQGEVDHYFPSVLPGGQAVLFTITTASGPDNLQVAVLDLKTGQRKTLIRGGGQAEYVDGYLIYAAAGTVRAVRFDPVRLEVLSDPVPVVEQVMTKPNGAAEFSVSRHGALVYMPGGVAGGTGVARTLVWVDRKGHEEPIKAPARAYQRAQVSPDGTRIALDVRDAENDIWTWDVAHETLQRLTVDPSPDTFPVWTTDSRRIIFASSRNGVANLYWQAADGSSPVERLTKSPNAQASLSLSADGTGVVVRETRSSPDLFLLHLDGNHAMDPLLQTAFEENNGVISPDGHWFAYDSNESGQFEVYVRPFPNVNGGHAQVSKRSGRAPLWAPNSHELFYVDTDSKVTAVPVLPPTSGTFNFGVAARLLDTAYYTPAPTRGYDISRDGQKFLMIKDPPASNQPTASGSASAPMVIVLNWLEELKARLPAK